MLSEGLLTINNVVFNRDLFAPALFHNLGLFYCVLRRFNVTIGRLGDLLDGLSDLLFTATLSNLGALGLFKLFLLRWLFFKFVIKVLSSRSVCYLVGPFARNLFDRSFRLFS